MKQLFTCLFFMLALQCYGQKFQLAPPRIHYNSVFFNDSLFITIEFNQPGTAIHYTTDGSDPNHRSPVYTKPIIITTNTVVRAISAGNNYFDSETAIARFIKAGLPIKKADYTHPNEVYATESKDILIDGKGGVPNFRNGQWLGYAGDTAMFTLYLHKKEIVDKVVLNLLQDENNWIFLPEQLLVYYYNDKEKTYVLCGEQAFLNHKDEPRQCIATTITLQIKEPIDSIRIIAIPTQVIPDRHIGKGNKSWLFIDEINVY